MDTDTAPHNRHWISIPLIAVILLLLAGLFFYVTRRGSPGPDFYVSGDPIDIRLVGIRPNSGDEVYDLEGNLIEKRHFGTRYIPFWEDDSLVRGLVFEFPEGPESTSFLSANWEVPSGQPTHASQGMLSPREAFEASNLIISIPRESPHQFLPFGRIPFINQYLSFFRYEWKEPNTHFDFRIEWLKGDRGSAELTFDGPFAIDTPVMSTEDSKISLTFKQGEFNRLIAEVDRGGATREIERKNPWILYDLDGKRFIGQPAIGMGRGGNQIEWFHLFFLDRVQTVTYKETTYQKTFHNIPITHPNWEDRSVAPYWEELKRRFPEKIKNPPPKYERPNLPAEIASRLPPVPPDIGLTSLEEILASTDIIRGRDLIRDVYEALTQHQDRKGISELNAKSRESLGRMFSEWVGSGDPEAIRMALYIGLPSQFPELIGVALDCLEATDSHSDESGVAASLGRSLSLASEEEFLRLADLLLDPKTEVYHRYLWHWFEENLENPKAAKAKDRLLEEGEVWHWWRILNDALPDDQENNHSTEKARSILRTKRDLHDLPPEVFGDSEDFENLGEILAQWITPRLFFLDQQGAFADIFGTFVESSSPESGTPILIGFLEAILEEWGEHSVRGDDLDETWNAIEQTLIVLNRWHDLELGGLPKEYDEAFGESPDGRDWPSLAREAIDWWRHRESPPTHLPLGWRPGQDDLRIVFKSLIDPELSLIAVWDASSEAREFHPWNYMELALEFFHFRIHRTDDREKREFKFEIQAGSGEPSGKTLEIAIETKELPRPISIGRETGARRSSDGSPAYPVTVWIGDWEVWVEVAGEDESVLSGTKLFEGWKEGYLQSSATAELLTRLHYNHPKERVLDYIRNRRRYQGWTEAEIALRRTMDQDPFTLTEDFRPYGDELSREMAVEAWREFLLREDLSVEMRFFAWVRIGQLEKGVAQMTKENERLSRAGEAFSRALEIDPSLICLETLQSRQSLIYCTEDPADRATRAIAFVEWMDSIADDQVEKSLNRPLVHNFHQFGNPNPPIRRLSKDCPPYGMDVLEDEIRRFQWEMKRSRETALGDLIKIIENLPTEAEALADTFREEHRKLSIK